MRLPWVHGLAASGVRHQHVERGNPGEVSVEPPWSRRFTISHYPLAVARIDPIGSPGQVASQTYTIYGASNFRSYLNRPDEQSRATCSTGSPQADKSNYWVPTLYWKYDDGTLEPLQSTMKTHYWGRGDANDSNYITPFPRGMRIRVGTPTTRDTSDIRSLYLGMHCQSTNTSPFLPNGDNSPPDCDNLIIAVSFPSCGLASQSLDSDNHFQHLTWPVETGGGHGFFFPYGLRCPPTHPIKYPTLNLETNYWLNDRMKASGWGPERLVLSNGDTVGTSFHANFVSGWDEDVLRDAVNNCFAPEEGQLPSCPPLAESIPSQPGVCAHEGMQPDENVGLFEPISQLPGANCRWSADMGNEKPNCPSTSTPGWTFPNLLWVNRGRTNSVLIPARLPSDQDMSQTALTAQYASKAAGTKSSFQQCSEDGNERMEILRNRANIRCGSNQDIQDNLDMASAVNKIDSVPDMQDTREYRNWVRCNPVGEEAWRMYPASQYWPNDDCWTASANVNDKTCISTADKVRGIA